jgi:hypothetical protein
VGLVYRTMDAATRRLIEALHRAPCQAVLAVSGGGTGAIGKLLGVPGGSRTILEAVVPYSAQSLTDFLGSRPEQSCSAETSRALAGRALDRGQWLSASATVVGLGSTASLASDRPKRGEHRVHVATMAQEVSRTFSLTLTKGARDRAGEEQIVDALILNALAQALGIAERVDLPLLESEQLTMEESPSLLGSFFREEVLTLRAEADGQMRGGAASLWDATRPTAMLPGAFNPIHAGHWALAAAAERLLGLPVAFELSVDNVDKPRLSPAEARRRLAQFAGRAPVWLTRAPTFSEKARLFPGAVFVVGADTAARLIAPRYYPKGEVGVIEALAFLRSQGCRFLVAGRVGSAGNLQSLEDLPIAPDFSDLFQAIPAAEFRFDISSTEIREPV